MIFYADDDVDDIEIFSDITEELGIDLMTFQNGSEVLEKLNNPPPTPCIIFLDINMPGLSGIEVLKIIRKNQKWSAIPVIMFSTSTSEDSVSQSFDLGATYFVPKTADYNSLRESIKHVVEQQWSEFERTEQTFVYPKSPKGDLFWKFRLRGLTGESDT